jgi:hypothetical protein
MVAALLSAFALASACGSSNSVGVESMPLPPEFEALGDHQAHSVAGDDLIAFTTLVGPPGADTEELRALQLQHLEEEGWQVASQERDSTYVDSGNGIGLAISSGACTARDDTAGREMQEIADELGDRPALCATLSP